MIGLDAPSHANHTRQETGLHEEHNESQRTIIGLRDKLAR